MKTLKFLSLLVLTTLALNELNAKILIMTHCYNRPDFIKWQYLTFKKFLKDEYEFIVFDDTPTHRISQQTQNICSELSIQCIRIPQTIHAYPYYLYRAEGIGGPSAECAETIQYMLDTVGFKHPGIVILIDSDMFLIRDFYVAEFLKNNEIAAFPQTKTDGNNYITYFLPNLIFFDMNLIKDKESINFSLNPIENINVDTGGHTHYYIKNHPNLKWLITDCKYHLNESNSNLNNSTLNYFKSNDKLYQVMTNPEFQQYMQEYYIDYSFLHLRAGSNWMNKGQEWIQTKEDILFSAIKQLLGNP